MNEKLLVDFKNVLEEVIQQHPDLEQAIGNDGYTLRNYVRRGLRHLRSRTMGTRRISA